jgi:hypothetical protein
VSDRFSPTPDSAPTGGRRSVVRRLLALITVVACWLGAFQAVVNTGKNTPLPWSVLAICLVIGFGAVAASGTSTSSRILFAAWTAMSWSTACGIAYLSKTDIMFGHYRGPFPWVQAATIGSWIGLACAVIWPVVRFGFDRDTWNWKTLVFGAVPLAIAALLMVPFAGDFVAWPEHREREELSDPHSARNEIQRIEMLRRSAEGYAGTPAECRRAIDNAGRDLRSEEGKAHWKQWEDEWRRQGKLAP